MMKYFAFGLAALILHSCSSTPEASPDNLGLPPDAASAPGEAAAPLEEDPFLLPEEGGKAQDSAKPSEAPVNDLATSPAEMPATPNQEAAAQPPLPPVPSQPPSQPPSLKPAEPAPLPKNLAEAEDQSAAQAKGEAPAPSAEASAPAGPKTAPFESAPPPYLSSDTQAAAPGLPAARTADSSAHGSYEAYEDRMAERARVEADLDRKALYNHEDGRWQFGLDFSPLAFDKFQSYDARTGTVRNEKAMGGAAQLLWFPLHTIKTGRLGIGPRLAGYMMDQIGNKKLSFYSAGVRATYEFDYWVGQVLVPFGLAGYDQVRFTGEGNPSTAPNFPAKRKFSSTVYGGGVSLNLNRLEATAAAKALADTGIRKFYLTYTYEQRSDDQNSGSSHYLGLRFEY